MLWRCRLALPPENIYGHTKKLRYIQRQLEAERQTLGATSPCSTSAAATANTSASTCLGRTSITSASTFMPPRATMPASASARRARFVAEPPTDQLFDALVYADVLEHLDDPAAVLRQHRPLLREGGLLIASIPNGYGPYEYESWFCRTFGIFAALQGLSRLRQRLYRKPGDVVPYNHESGHVQFFTRPDVDRLLAQTDFRLVDFMHGAFVCGPLCELTRLLGPSIACWNAAPCRPASRLGGRQLVLHRPQDRARQQRRHKEHTMSLNDPVRSFREQDAR